MTETMMIPVLGKVKDITECSDSMFSEKMLGDGILIEPSNNIIVAPCNGKIITVSKTKHAVTMISETGVELIIHIGIDTVELDGKGFLEFVSNNEDVKVGQRLIQVDFDYVKSKGYDTDTMFVVLSQEIKIEKLNLNVLCENYVEIIKCMK